MSLYTVYILYILHVVYINSIIIHTCMCFNIIINMSYLRSGTCVVTTKEFYLLAHRRSIAPPKGIHACVLC